MKGESSNKQSFIQSFIGNKQGQVNRLAIKKSLEISCRKLECNEIIRKDDRMEDKNNYKQIEEESENHNIASSEYLREAIHSYNQVFSLSNKIFIYKWISIFKQKVIEKDLTLLYSNSLSTYELRNKMNEFYSNYKINIESTPFICCIYDYENDDLLYKLYIKDYFETKAIIIIELDNLTYNDISYTIGDIIAIKSSEYLESNKISNLLIEIILIVDDIRNITLVN